MSLTWRFFHNLLALALLGCGGILSGIWDGQASAQGIGTREYPTPEYYLGFRLFDEGDFASALDAFRSAAKSGIRSTEGRWVDSICYHTMMGECFYQVGDLRAALEQYTAALNLFVVHQQWMIRVDFSPGIEPARRTRRVANWGVSARRAVVGEFGDRYPILQGRLDNERVIVQGGIIALPEYILVNAPEIARCTALATSRRRELMGSASRHDALTRQVLQAISTRPGRVNHWSQAWINVQLGMAAAANGNTQQAVTELGNGILAAGGFDHPLTPLALLELGKLAFEQEQYKTASNFFHEASLSGVTFGQYALVEEALRLAAKTHLVTNQQAPYPALAPATAWARRESRFLEASLLIAAAENAVVLRQTSAAAQLVEQARRRMIRTEMGPSSVGARLSYAAALVNYQAGNLKAGDAAFANLMQFQKRGSKRLFEIAIVDQFFNSGVVSERIANTLYAEVLREPTGADWVTAPVETQSVLLSPNLAGPLENWLRTALLRREHDVALEIADRIRRHRFYSTLPMGGRLLSLRWVLNSPVAALGEHAVLQRQTLLGQFPHYAELLRRSNAVQQQLQEMAPVPDEEATRVKQRDLFIKLHTLSTEQERVLREIALRRAPADMVFPPPLNFEQAQARLEPGQSVLSFLITSRAVYVFRFGRDSYSAVEQLAEPGRIEEGIVAFLRSLGQLDRNQALSVETLLDTRWQPIAAALFEQLGQRGLPAGTDELIVVPDGPLWYLPFEALLTPDGDGVSSVISRYRVRYAPTVALAFPDQRRVSQVSETAVLAGRLFPRDDEAVSAAATEELQKLVPNVSNLNGAVKVPGDLFATICDRLIVFDDLDQGTGGPYGWSPLPLDRGKKQRPLSRWMSLPWGGPQQIVLPGFHTAAEVSLKRGGNGNEVFLSLCGLMSTGARTVLISRWRPGGQSTYDLVREFVQELPFTTAADAWQRSVQLVSSSELMLDREPRVSPVEPEVELTTNHPFFWASQMLVDTGAAAVSDAPAEKPR